MRLFRQPKRGDWAGVIDRMGMLMDQNKRETIAELAEIVNGGGAMAQTLGRRRG